MPLSNERIKELLALKNAPKKGRSGKPKFDPNDRSFKAWFALQHQLYDHDTGDPTFCENPDCVDTRDKTHGQSVGDFNGTKICRFCFLEGWLTTHQGQQVIR